ASYSGSAPPLALGQAICFSFARQSGTDLSSFSWTYECSFLSVVRFGAKHQGTSALLNHPIENKYLTFFTGCRNSEGKDRLSRENAKNSISYVTFYLAFFIHILFGNKACWLDPCASFNQRPILESSTTTGVLNRTTALP